MYLFGVYKGRLRKTDLRIDRIVVLKSNWKLIIWWFSLKNVKCFKRYVSGKKKGM